MTHATLVANGDFPTHPTALAALSETGIIVCCDAAISTLIDSGFVPHERQQVMVVGDGDSLSPERRASLLYPLHIESEQDDNDLTKSFRWLLNNTNGPLYIKIIGATGKREDHTLGNLSLLMRYHIALSEQRPGSNIVMITDYGIFTPVVGKAAFKSFPRQQVSIFSLTPDQPVSVEGLQYPIHERCIWQWWEASLNAALGDSFSVQGGQLLVFQTHEAKD